MTSADQAAIQVTGLGKAFRFYSSKWRQLEAAIFASKNHSKDQWVLRDIRFRVECGTTLGIIGQNGAGKTTLLQLLAGLMRPTEGTLAVRGKIATLLELGSGFETSLTGRENVFISGALRGFSRKQLDEKLEDIVQFAGLADCIDRPIRSYSAGMVMRLAFAIATSVEPDILLIDEVFSVGDLVFQHRCAERFRKMQNQGTTIVLVTHDLAALKSFCQSSLLLHEGRQIMFDSPAFVSEYYLKLCSDQEAAQEQQIYAEPTFEPFRPNRHGSGNAVIRDIRLLNSDGTTVSSVGFGETVTFRFVVEYLMDIPFSILGFYVRDRYGNDILGTNTYEEGYSLGAHKEGDQIEIDFTMQLTLRPGSYSISPALAEHRNDPIYLDWIDNAYIFEVQKATSGQIIYGFVHLPVKTEIKSS